MLYKLGISTLWMFVLPGMHPDYCYMLSGSCTPPPCSCSLLGSYMRLLESCPLPQMPDSVYTSTPGLLLYAVGLLHAAAVLLLAAAVLLPATANAKLCLRVTRES